MSPNDRSYKGTLSTARPNRDLPLSTLIYATVALIGIPALGSAEMLPTGDEVVAKVNARDEGTVVVRDLTMELTDRRGKQRIRETRGYRKYFGDEKRTSIFYLSPNNIRDTAFLTYDYPEVTKDDDQWLYLPALRKTRRISASDRGDYFLGTDFTYEDIKKESKIGAEDYRFRTLRTDEIDGFPVLVIEGIPVSDEIAEELGYGRAVMWVDSEVWISRKTELWDHHGKALKTIHSSDIRRVDGIWTTHRLEVENHQTDHQTLFSFKNVRYEVEVDDALFTEGALRRGI